MKHEVALPMKELYTLVSVIFGGSLLLIIIKKILK